MQAKLNITPAMATGQTDQHITWLNARIGIHQHIVTDWQNMQTAAKADGIELAIASGFRAFDRQLAIWQKKAKGELKTLDINEKSVNISLLEPLQAVESIMLFSALPGASRHHWGTDVDVYSPNLLPDNYQLQLTQEEYAENGVLAELSQWLKANATNFNFYFPYNTYTGGIAAEPWHLSHQVAKQFEQVHSVSLITEVLTNTDIEFKEILLKHLPMLYNRFINLSKAPLSSSHL